MHTCTYTIYAYMAFTTFMLFGLMASQVRAMWLGKEKVVQNPPQFGAGK